MAKLQILFLFLTIVCVQAKIRGRNEIVVGKVFTKRIKNPNGSVVNYGKLKAKNARVCMKKCRNLIKKGFPCEAWRWRQDNKKFRRMKKKLGFIESVPA